jgi:N-acetylmuramoyl-L-alanine amidase
MGGLGTRDPPLNDRSFSAFPQIASAAAVLGIAVIIVVRLVAQGAAPLILLAREGRRALAVTSINNQEFVALDDLAAAFQLAVREESGAITVAYRASTIVLTPDQALASVSGRLISLPAAPTRAGGRWLVPLDFISRALAPIYDTRLDFRRASRLLVIGDLRVPTLAVRYEALINAARVTIDATPPAASTITQDDGRLTIRFDADTLDVAVPAVQPQGLVQAIRSVDAVTLALDLGPRYAGFRSSSQTTGNTTRLVIDFAAAATDTAATPLPPPLPPADLPVFGQQVSAIRTIAIDPGHGGEDHGTAGAGGLTEKELTLAVARRLKVAIEGRLGVRVLLTRDEDRRVPLDERTAVANNNKADLFISLHANASMRPAASGASIYVAAFDESARASARHAPERVTVFGGGLRDIELVLWDLAQIRHVDHSVEFARILQQEFGDRVPLAPRPLERAPFRVLESANMPAVMIEMGYLTNGAQEKQLADPSFQNGFAQAVYDAVLKFRDYLMAQGGER